jgi:hypothetical protein
LRVNSAKIKVINTSIRKTKNGEFKNVDDDSVALVFFEPRMLERGRPISSENAILLV